MTNAARLLSGYKDTSAIEGMSSGLRRRCRNLAKVVRKMEMVSINVKTETNMHSVTKGVRSTGERENKYFLIREILALLTIVVFC